MSSKHPSLRIGVVLFSLHNFLVFRFIKKIVYGARAAFWLAVGDIFSAPSHPLAIYAGSIPRDYNLNLEYIVKSKLTNSSDGRVVWSVCLLSCRLEFDSKSGQTNDVKIGIHSFPA